jgi:hypothetical protein
MAIEFIETKHRQEDMNRFIALLLINDSFFGYGATMLISGHGGLYRKQGHMDGHP